MTNDPVAWTDGRGNYFDKNSFFPVDDLTPLYTHSVKKLTDKEVLELWDWDSGEILATDLLDFADAILRKAQEK